MIMRHGPYIAAISYDEDEGLFAGSVINALSTITFYGDTPRSLKREFKKSVDVYLVVCKERGVNPGKPFSGKLPLRMPPELHARVAATAAASDMSQNAWIVNALDREANHIDD